MGGRFFVIAATLVTGLLGAWLILFAFSVVLPPLEYSSASPDGNVGASRSEEDVVVRHLPTPEPVKALYMSSWTAATPTFRSELVQLADESEINALVIDIKDYTGRIAFEVTDPKLKVLGSADKRIADIHSFIEELHEKNIYVIGRIVVFQDPFLATKQPELAVKRVSNGQVWKDFKGLSWLDPAAPEVWDYIIAISKEAIALGFDELNYDYVRFPSDGNMDDLAYPFFDGKSKNKSQVLKDFFTHLKKELAGEKIPLSIDLFGMTTTNTDDLNIGQVLEDAAPYFDYIAPMVYPSHYPPGFLNYKNPAAFPYEIIKYSMDEASRRLLAATTTTQKLRPWLQDFNLGAMYTPEMIKKEKQAVYDAGLTSWMMWSAANSYTTAALDK